MQRGRIKKNLLGNKMFVAVANTIIVVAEADAKTEKKIVGEEKTDKLKGKHEVPATTITYIDIYAYE